MLYNTISTLGMTQKLQNSLTQLQIERMKTADEMSTGRHFDVAAAIGAQTGRAVSLRNLFDQTTNQVTMNAQLDARFTAMDTALNNALTAGIDALSLASVGLGQESPTGGSLQVRARATLDQIISQLNASSGNEYLFAGTQLDEPPLRLVDAEDPPLRSPLAIVTDAIAAATGGPAAPETAAQTANVVAVLDEMFGVRDPATPPASPLLTDTFEGGFYEGTTQLAPGGAANPRLSGRADANTTLPYGIQANDPQIRDLMQGLYMLAAVDVTKLPPQAYEPYMQAAVDKIASGVAGLRDSIAQLGIQHATLDTSTDYQKANLTILNKQITDLEEVDPAEASVRLDQIELQIDATASVTARIAQMSLTKFL